MKVNEHTAVSTSKVLLVPYSQHHVPTYHAFMQDPDLQSATASDPLRIDEEYAMQQSWLTDQDKLTFIVCTPLHSTSSVKQSIDVIRTGEHDSPDRMIGDINLFLVENEEDNDSFAVEKQASDPNHSRPGLVGEVELMIARKDLQHQGYGRAALITFLHYVLSNWQQIAEQYQHGSGTKIANGLPTLEYLRAKINHTNEPSTRLFESIGFHRTGSGPNYFGEVDLRWYPDIEDLTKLKCYEQPRLLQYEDGL